MKKITNISNITLKIRLEGISIDLAPGKDAILQESDALKVVKTYSDSAQQPDQTVLTRSLVELSEYVPPKKAKEEEFKPKEDGKKILRKGRE